MTKLISFNYRFGLNLSVLQNNSDFNSFINIHKQSKTTKYLFWYCYFYNVDDDYGNYLFIKYPNVVEICQI